MSDGKKCLGDMPGAPGLALQSAEPDLKIVIGGGDEGGDMDGEKEEEEVKKKRKYDEAEDKEQKESSKDTTTTSDCKTTRWYNAAVMAVHSKYIDTMLASSMKESETYEISFPDIDVKTWDRMIQFLNVSEARMMNVDDVLAVGQFYDKYDFVEAKRLCDILLLVYFQKAKDRIQRRSLDLNVLVDAVILAFSSNFATSAHAGMALIKMLLTNSSFPLGRAIFEEEHIEKMIPLILEFAKDDNDFLENLSPRKPWAMEDVQSPLFPRCFTTECQSNEAYDRLNYEALQSITLTLPGAWCRVVTMKKIPGTLWRRLESDEPRRYRNGLYKVVAEPFKNDGETCWWISAHPLAEGQPHMLYKCPYSHAQPLPPTTGWIAVGPNNNNKMAPEIKYKFRD